MLLRPGSHAMQTGNSPTPTESSLAAAVVGWLGVAEDGRRALSQGVKRVRGAVTIAAADSGSGPRLQAFAGRA